MQAATGLWMRTETAWSLREWRRQLMSPTWKYVDQVLMLLMWGWNNSDLWRMTPRLVCWGEEDTEELSKVWRRRMERRQMQPKLKNGQIKKSHVVQRWITCKQKYVLCIVKMCVRNKSKPLVLLKQHHWWTPTPDTAVQPCWCFYPWFFWA